ncbi:OadG family protein [Marinomonas ostreistagni]|uniref:OadG family protein n=1 Tax=Marinomonas ostreistagni TaxID=359209 RepID=UPI00194E08C9|nr:OadG family transporter subunit [Marinomonas ostreistagni]MBM6552104.1 OadG family protein [Marinomonas ostreistagni]
MNNLINDGLGLMLLGMGFVFLFLCILIVATTFMSKLVARYFPEAAPVIKKTVSTPTPIGAQGTDPKVAAAITAAIHQHRNR